MTYISLHWLGQSIDELRHHQKRSKELTSQVTIKEDPLKRNDLEIPWWWGISDPKDEWMLFESKGIKSKRMGYRQGG